VHWSFDIMVGTGSAMLAVAAWVARRPGTNPEQLSQPVSRSAS